MLPEALISQGLRAAKQTLVFLVETTLDKARVVGWKLAQELAHGPPRLPPMTSLKPVFILGAPRTGTTMLGRYVASHKEAVDLGEFFGFFLTLRHLREVTRRVPSSYRDAYLEHLVGSTTAFADSAAEAAGVSIWCDQTPWNLLIIDELVARFPTALFVLSVRHYSGTILSLQRSFKAGYNWAGRTMEDSAKLWSRFYGRVVDLPKDRTIAISYDGLCADPIPTLARLREQLAEHLSVDPLGFDDCSLAESHATEKARPTLAYVYDGRAHLRPINSLEPGAWTTQIERVTRPIVATTDQWLRLHLPDVYEWPKGFAEIPA